MRHATDWLYRGCDTPRPSDGAMTGSVLDSGPVPPWQSGIRGMISIMPEPPISAATRSKIRELRRRHDSVCLAARANRRKAQNAGTSTGLVIDLDATDSSDNDEEQWRNVEKKPKELVALQCRANYSAIHGFDHEGTVLIATDGSALRTTDKKPARGGGAAAAMVAVDEEYDAADSPRIDRRKGVFEEWYVSGTQKNLRCGPNCCSFTPEVEGLHLAVDIAEHDPDLARVKHVMIATDSQSALSALALGPTRQRDARLARLWHRLITLASSRGLRFSFRFVFGHCRFGPNEIVDHAAGAVAEEGALSDIHRWWKDAARVPPKEIIKLTNPSAAPHEDLSLRKQLKGPSAWPLRYFKNWSQTEIRNLCQIRTNAWPVIGGHLIGEAGRVACTLCGVQTIRRALPREDNDAIDDGPEIPLAEGARGPLPTPALESLVSHVFTCRRLRTARRRRGIRSAKDLWNRPRDAYSLFDYYAHGPNQQGIARLEELQSVAGADLDADDGGPGNGHDTAD